MNADAHPLSTVFGLPRQLTAPLFQRPYVWVKDKQWEPLWEDIRTMAEALERGRTDVRPHFLGAIVLDQVLSPLGKVETRSIIDGQQRLATLQVFFAAFRDISRGLLDEEKIPQAIEKLMFNDDPMLEDGPDRFRVLPTNVDRPAYEVAMTAGSPREATRALEGKGPLDGHLFKAYSYFHEALSEWLGEDHDRAPFRAEALLGALRGRLVLVVIDIGDEDDAQMIFETLNARGTPLLPADLVKNYLFRQADAEQADVEALYEAHWKPFEADHGFWRGETGYGRQRRPRIDIFLHHYLTLVRVAEVSPESLFSEFQHYARDNEDMFAGDHLAQMREYADTFKSFLEATLPGREGMFFQRLNSIDTATVFPFLLGLYRELGAGDDTAEERLAVLTDLESFLVRRIVCGLTTKNYNRLFLDLIEHLHRAGGFCHASVREFLLQGTGDSVRWPDDAEFHEAWVSRLIYEKVTRRRLYMILGALDRALHSDKTEPYEIKGRLTIEHIMPQHWSEHWPLPARDETPEERLARIAARNTALHAIGNLTLLTRQLNPAISNGPFDRKREEILRHTVLNLSRFLHCANTWDETLIRTRSEDLWRTAKRIWPYPVAPAAPE